MNMTIIVATHIPFWVPPNSIYTPIQAGAAGKPSIGYLRDDSGDNISEKNPYYCELTALYWAYKHIKQEDYIGLCRFRRYMGKTVYTNSNAADAILSEKDFAEIFKEYDCVLPKKRSIGEGNLRSQYMSVHHAKDLLTLEALIKQRFPDYYESFKLVMNMNEIYAHNMFVLKKELFDNYCDFLFNVLFDLEALIDISNYTEYEKRVFTYMGEILFNVWYVKHQPRTKEVLMLYLEQISWGKRLLKKLKEKILAK